MSMSEQENHMSRIYHGSKELKIASTAADTHSSSPMDTYAKNLWTTGDTSGDSTAPEVIVRPELTGGHIIKHKSLPKRCLHYSSVAPKPSDKPYIARTLYRKGFEVLAGMKKYLAIWHGCLNKDGTIPSGKTAFSILQEVQ